MLPPPNPKEINRKQRLALADAVVPEQDPVERRCNFEEVYLPFDEASAKAAAERCIQCPGAVCIKACPPHNDISLALCQLEHGQFEEAAKVFRLTSTMPEVCGRVCPQVILCEGACIYNKKGKAPVPVGRLEAFLADYLQSHAGLPTATDPPTGHLAAVVGAGPAGLTVACSPGGDDVLGPKLVVTAVAQAHVAAEAMHAYLSSETAAGMGER